MEREQDVAQTDTRAGRFLKHLHVLESVEAREVRERLAHVPHRQQLTGPCLDQTTDHPVVDESAFLLNADFGNDGSGLSVEETGSDDADDKDRG